MSKRYRFSQADCRRGGRATASKRVAAWTCPRCQQPFQDAPQLALTGHLGLHSFADHYAGGELRLATEKLGLCGVAASDPYPETALSRERMTPLPMSALVARSSWKQKNALTCPESSGQSVPCQSEETIP